MVTVEFRQKKSFAGLARALNSFLRGPARLRVVSEPCPSIRDKGEKISVYEDRAHLASAVVEFPHRGDGPRVTFGPDREPGFEKLSFGEINLQAVFFL